jgi:hypothetical protein
MPRIRIFVSFDGEHDADLNDLLQAQSTRPGSAFAVCAHSRGGSMTEAWVTISRMRIRAADEVVVICGEHTGASQHVAAELRIAQEEERPYLLLWGRRGRMCTRPATARTADGTYSWTWEILQSQIVSLRRSGQASDRQAELRRYKSAPSGRPARPR